MTATAWLGTHPLVSALVVLHGVALATSVSAILLRRQTLRYISLGIFIMAFVLNTWVIADRWIQAGRAPFKTLYETLLFYPWCVAVVTLVLIGLHRLYVLTPFAAGVSLMGLGYALYRPDVEIINLPPALQSGWFVPHVVIYFVAYAALFISFVLAVLALITPRWGRVKELLPVSADADSGFEQHAHAAAVFGVTALTLGLVMGAIWGKYAWGDYWSWDPKENWALVSWLAYLIYLHLRLMSGWGKRRASWILVFAFGAIVFTYLGVGILPAAQESLHVYQ